MPNPGEIKILKSKQYKIGILKNGEPRDVLEPKFQQKPAQPISISGKSLIEEYKIRTFDEYLRSPKCPYAANKTVGIYENKVSGGDVECLYLGEGNPIKISQSNSGLADDSDDSMKQMASSRDPEFDAISKAINPTIELLNKQIASLNAANDELRKDYNDYQKRVIENEVELNKRINELTAKNYQLDMENKAIKEYTEKAKAQGLADGPGVAEKIGSRIMEFASQPAISEVVARALNSIMDKFMPTEAETQELEAHAQPQIAEPSPVSMKW